MDIEKANKLLDSLSLESQITLNDIPQIDLYMDQVIQLFENKFSSTRRYKDDKVLTKTMINNYAKDKLFIPVKNKKYSKDHLLLISLIYQLKGALSIQDIKESLNKVNEKIEEDVMDLEGFYKTYLEITNKNLNNFRNDLALKSDEIKEQMNKIEDQNTEDLEKVLMILSLVNMSNYYRRTAEKLVDNLVESKKGTK